jgi:D-3-phosphoglycerate dehydrogenase
MEYLRRFAEPYIINSVESTAIVEGIKGMDGLICRGGIIDRGLLEQARTGALRVIGRTAVGMNNTDLVAATDLGIPIVYTPGANARSVAEYAVTGMLAIQKKVMDCDREMRLCNYQSRFSYCSREFINKMVLLVGFGNIGQEVARMCTGLSMKISVYDKYTDRKTIEAFGYTYCDELLHGLEYADFVSLHIPLTAETEKIIDSIAFDYMKPTAYLINTARGGVVDEEELRRRLDDNRIAGAVIDTLVDEPEIANSRLIGAPNTLFSPHIAAQTTEAMYRMAKDCIDGLISVLEGRRWSKTANMDVYNRPEWNKRN